MTQKTKNIISAAVVVVAAAGATAGYLYNKKYNAPLPKGAIIRTQASANHAVKGFPAILLPDPQAKIDESFQVTYPKYTNSTTIFTTSGTPAVMYAYYTSPMPQYHIVQSQDKTSPFTVDLVTPLAKNRVHVTISSVNNKTVVGVTDLAY